MNIEWNNVTWYSKLLAVVVFLATLFIGITIGMQYQSLVDGAAQTQRAVVQPETRPVAAEGQHCGGFIKNAPKCATGYHCQLGRIPDTGGVCVKD